MLHALKYLPSGEAPTDRRVGPVPPAWRMMPTTSRARRLYLDGLDAGGGLTEAQLAVRERWLRQLDAERSALVRSVERYLRQMQDAKARGSAAELPPGRGKVLEWFGPLVEAIRAEQEAVRGRACFRGPSGHEVKPEDRLPWPLCRADGFASTGL